MIKLFHIEDYIINTQQFNHILHGDIVNEVEKLIAEYVGAKYACSVNSATNAIFLSLLNKNVVVSIPSMIPPVVLNAIITSGNKIKFVDNINWVGNSYILYDFGEYKIIDSAQRLDKNQFKNEANPNDLMFFSFYPTKPVGGIDGGMFVSDDYEKIKWFKEATFNGMEVAINNWERKPKFPGWKMYMNSVQAFVVKENFLRLGYKYEQLSRIREIYNREFGLNNTSNHLYRINVLNRDITIKKFKEKNISCGIHYVAQHLNPVYAKKEMYVLPKSTKEKNTTLSIPFHEKLTDKELNIIIGETHNAI